MGVNIKDLLSRKEIEINDLKNKPLAIDAFNILYQFLTTIRQRDGSLLTDSQGRVTSHLTGLFNRSVKLMSQGLKLCYVFDGIVPDLKKAERERRKKLKLEAAQKYVEAVDAEDLEAMKKYAARTTKLEPEMVDEAKELVEALGLPIVQAPSEGEAQAAYMTRNDDVWATVSQDYDSLLFGSTRTIHNLTISERKKQKGALSYGTVKPEIIGLSETLNNIGVDQEQLIVLGLLVGTDYNIGGIKGIGPKNALKLLKEFGNDFEGLFKKVEWDKQFDFSWRTVFDLIKNMPVKKDYKLEWKMPDIEKIKQLLVDKYDFNEERVMSQLDKLKIEQEQRQQKTLGEF
ncbi:flap endonuclease-1 [Candidatus Woesearchaeota archaeon]|nr:flap endonuclease-1 [Candidatus Woesearchaeota archaeon]